MNPINIKIKKYFRNSKIKLKEVASHLGVSPSNLTERLNSTRSITLDEFFILYDKFGDDFAITVMRHYGSRMLFLEKIKRLILIIYELKSMYEDVRNKNEEVYEMLEHVKEGIEEFEEVEPK